MIQIDTKNPFRVKEVWIRNNRPIKDCLVWVSYHFLVVAKDETDPVTTWYNLNFVDKLEGVEEFTAWREASTQDGRGLYGNKPTMEDRQAQDIPATL